MFKSICGTPSENFQVYLKTGTLAWSGVLQRVIRKIARDIAVTHILYRSIKWQKKKISHKSNVSFKCPLENTTYQILATCFSKLLIRTTRHVQRDALHNWKLDIDTQIRESGSQRRKCFRLPGHALRKKHCFRQALIRSY